MVDTIGTVGTVDTVDTIDAVKGTQHGQHESTRSIDMVDTVDTVDALSSDAVWSLACARQRRSSDTRARAQGDNSARGCEPCTRLAARHSRARALGDRRGSRMRACMRSAATQCRYSRARACAQRGRDSGMRARALGRRVVAARHLCGRLGLPPPDTLSVCFSSTAQGASAQRNPFVL